MAHSQVPSYDHAQDDNSQPTNIPGLLDGRAHGEHPHSNTQDKSCLACNTNHPTGNCPLKRAGVEFCPLCGLAHYGSGSRACPHLNSVTQCRAMLDALKSSTETKEYIEYAKRYLVSVIGNLKRRQKLKEANALQNANHMGMPMPPPYNEQGLGLPGTASKPSYAGSYPNGVHAMDENRVVLPGNSNPPSVDEYYRQFTT